MNPKNEIDRRNKRIESYKAEVEELKEENTARTKASICGS